MIKIYSTPTCHYCKEVKNLLNDKGLEYEEIDVLKNLEARQDIKERSGQLGVPVTEINGELFVGFTEELKNRLNNLN